MIHRVTVLLNGTLTRDNRQNPQKLTLRRLEFVASIDFDAGEISSGLLHDFKLVIHQPSGCITIFNSTTTAANPNSCTGAAHIIMESGEILESR